MSTDAQAPWEREGSGIAGQVANRLARRIIRGEVFGGTVLTEPAVAAELGVSRTPVREAMLTLQRWGLVQLLPKKGALVKPVLPQDVNDLLDVREVIEVAALGQVVTDPARREGLDAVLDASLDKQRDALESGELVAFATADLEFHLGVIRAAQNPVMEEMVLLLGPRFARMLHDMIRTHPDHAGDLYADHEIMRAAVARGDTDAAINTLRAHIAHSPYRQPR